MPPDIIIPPAVEPVDLAYAKTFLRVDGTDEDSLITDMLLSARLRIERYSQHALITRRLRECREGKPAISFSVMPVNAVHSVQVVAQNGQMLQVDPEHYVLNTRRSPAQLILLNHRTWQSFISDFDHVEIEYSAGFGTQASDIPMPFKQAILLLTAQSYERREQTQTQIEPSVPMMVDALLMPYRWVRL